MSDTVIGLLISFDGGKKITFGIPYREKDHFVSALGRMRALRLTLRTVPKHSFIEDLYLLQYENFLAEHPEIVNSPSLNEAYEHPEQSAATDAEDDADKDRPREKKKCAICSNELPQQAHIEDGSRGYCHCPSILGSEEGGRVKNDLNAANRGHAQLDDDASEGKESPVNDQLGNDGSEGNKDKTQIQGVTAVVEVQLQSHELSDESDLSGTDEDPDDNDWGDVDGEEATNDDEEGAG